MTRIRIKLRELSPAARARMTTIAIVATCLIALVSGVLALRAISTQTDVSRREAQRAVATVEETQRQLAEQQRASCAFWRDLGSYPGPLQSEFGRLLVKDARDAADRMGCPP